MQILKGKKSLNFAFLLGAGASVEAGLPTLKSLTKSFVSYLEITLPHLHQSLHDIFSSSFHEMPEGYLPDAESLLGHLERIIDWRHPQLLKYVRDAGVMQHELRKFIWETLGQHGKSGYLDPLQALLSKTKPIHIFSLNNDLVIEDWCYKRGVQFFDGFSQNGIWDTSSFKDSTADILLYKIHGSTNWVRDKTTDLLINEKTPRRIALKLRVARTPVPDTALLFPAHTKDLLYPPLLQVFSIFYQKLHEIDALIIVGCRLQDVHIHRAIKHALIENPKLHILIVDPESAKESAEQINVNISSVWERVSTLKMRFSSLLQSNLEAILESLLTGRRDDIEFLQRSLAQIQQKNGARIIMDASRYFSTQPAFSEDKKRAIQEICETMPELPKDIDSPLDSILAVIHPPNAADDLAERLQHTAEMLKIYRAPSCYGIYQDNGTIYVISGQVGRLMRYDTITWKSVDFGPKFVNPRGMTVYNNTAYIIECSFLNFEGFGVLYAVDLASTQKRRIFPAKWLSQDILKKLKSAKFSRNLTSTIRDLIEPLSWPSSVRVLKNGQMACIIEARKVRIIDLKNGKTTGVSPPRFFNLADVVEWDYPNMILLESARTGGGNISWYNVETDKREIIIEGITGASGLALFPDRTGLLYTEGRPRPNGKLFIVRDFQTKPQVKMLLDGINKPRHMTITPDGIIYLASRDGVLRLKKKLSELA